uniref:NAC family transcription factor n=1 Tax=Melilotus albus TaxID=47082 RepID=A0A896WCU8_MELAB|nr:NAC family transcription factor [Melilotus albus]
MAVDKHAKIVLEDGTQLPVGFRFDPTDQELVDYYLIRKVCNQPLPISLLEIDVFQSEPWRLPEDNRTSSKQMRYYFFDTRNLRFENMNLRPAGNGEWRLLKRNEELALSNKHFIGRKNTFVFSRMEGNQVVMTQWRMDEFGISTIYHPTKVAAISAYRIFKMKAAKAEKKKVLTPTVIDFTMDDGSVSAPPAPSP